VVAFDRGGACVVRLDNGHLINARSPRARCGEAAGAASLPGRIVSVEMAHDDMRGWRIARRP
jgi:hypothetical protein